jgi:glucosamine kinase
LANEEGTILAGREGGSSLIGDGRDSEVAADIVEHVRTLAREGGIGLPLHALCAGLAGSAGRPEGTRQFREELLRSGVAYQVQVIPDAEVAFEDAFGEGEGILIIAGTGSIALGRGEDGILKRVGGWGALLGDEGSAYRIALQGLRAATSGAEGIGTPTLLTSTFFQRLKVDAPRGILAWSQGAAKGDIASLAPAVFDTAAAGDRVAHSILEEAIEGILNHARALHRALFADRDLRQAPIPGALVGGIIEAGGPLHQEVVRRLRAEGIEIVTDPVDPPRGAVRMALRM